jgi:hypothetical protein
MRKGLIGEPELKVYMALYALKYPFNTNYK